MNVTPPSATRAHRPEVQLGLAAGVAVTQVAAGDSHTCALASDGSVRW